MASKDRDTDVLEQGDIYFMYRPKVEHEEAEGFGDVERFYLALKPDGASRYRLIVIGRKRLPDVDDHERNWGFVDMVCEAPRKIEQRLREEHYDTKTRGERTRPAARPAGEGKYAIARVGRDMHLVYALELPEQPGAVQKALNIAPEAGFVLSVKNPEKGSPRAAGLQEDEQADYPKKLQEEFRDRKFASEDPRLLDYAGAEVLLVGARRDPERAYDVDIDTEHESLDTADIVKRLKMVQSRHPVEPLVRGEWQ